MEIDSPPLIHILPTNGSKSGEMECGSEYHVVVAVVGIAQREFI